MDSITDSIRNRAFNLFEHRNRNGGSDLDDWLQAERDLLLTPDTELTSDAKKFIARIALPGF